MGSFTIDEKKYATKVELKFAGSLGEDADFSKVDLKGVEQLEIDLDGIERMNSTGTKNWIVWIRTFPPGLKVTFKKCTRTFIDQASLIQGLFPKSAVIESFYTPYFCDACQKGTPILMMKGSQFTSSHIKYPSNVPCQHCGKPAELDIIEETYGKFLEYLKSNSFKG